MTGIRLVSMVVITLVGPLEAAPAVASPQMLAKAAEKGLPAKNCQYCHVSAGPTKDRFKVEDLNERGQWLLAEKAKQNAKTVDVDWLKSYVGSKDQK
jgi:hypothetical protein